LKIQNNGSGYLLSTMYIRYFFRSSHTNQILFVLTEVIDNLVILYFILFQGVRSHQELKNFMNVMCVNFEQVINAIE